MADGTIQALVCCQVQACAEEQSFPLDMVKMYLGKPICQECFAWGPPNDEIDWRELPDVSLEDLFA